MSDGRESYDDDGAGEDAGRRPAGRDGHVDASRLPAELRALGRSLDARGGVGGAGSETMVERVLAQILAEHLPVPVQEPGPTGVRRGCTRSGAGRGCGGGRWWQACAVC